MFQCPHSTLKRVEVRPGAIQANSKTVWAQQEALDKVGNEFIHADSKRGLGVRLRHPELLSGDGS